MRNLSCACKAYTASEGSKGVREFQVAQDFFERLFEARDRLLSNHIFCRLRRYDPVVFCSDRKIREAGQGFGGFWPRLGDGEVPEGVKL